MLKSSTNLYYNISLWSCLLVFLVNIAVKVVSRLKKMMKSFGMLNMKDIVKRLFLVQWGAYQSEFTPLCLNINYWIRSLYTFLRGSFNLRGSTNRKYHFHFHVMVWQAWEQCGAMWIPYTLLWMSGLRSRGSISLKTSWTDY